MEKNASEPRNFNERETAVLEKVRKLWNVFSGDIEAFEKYEEDLQSLKEEIRAKGDDPYQYFLFHKIIGSSSAPEAFDTRDLDFEKFVEKNYEEYA